MAGRGFESLRIHNKKKPGSCRVLLFNGVAKRSFSKSRRNNETDGAKRKASFGWKPHPRWLWPVVWGCATQPIPPDPQKEARQLPGFVVQRRCETQFSKSRRNNETDGAQRKVSFW